MAKAVEEATHAFQGENAAMTWALLWAIHISDWCYAVFGSQDIHFAFNFDAMNTGYQTAGLWRTKDHLQWKTLLRALAQVLQRRHRHSHLHWNHIKAHSQHPLNEFVDALAKFAVTHCDQVAGSQSWMKWLEDPHVLQNIQWLWYTEHLATAPDVTPTSHDMVLIHQASPDQLAADSLQEATSPPAEDELDWHPIEITVKLATANVLTLSTDSSLRGISCTKQQLIQKQFHDEGCLVIGVQETRHKRVLDQHNEWYHIVGHAASADGTDGVQLWFSKTLHIYDSSPLIQMKHITIVASQPDFIIARLCMPHFRAIFVTGRAPHGGRAGELSVSFWKNITQQVRLYEKDHLLFFLGDTNGHLGEHITTAVGSHAGSAENGPGTEFHNWMLHHRLCAPSTFEHSHIGSRTTTFCTPDGEHRTRIDYIAVPSYLHYDCLQTWVAEQIDLCGVREDHTAVIGRLQFTKDITSQSRRRPPPPRIDRQELVHQLMQPEIRQQLADTLQDAPWTLDPHQSADWLAMQTAHALARIVPRAARWRRKRHISAELWQKVDEKRAAFRQLQSMKRTWRTTCLQLIFTAWKSGQSLIDRDEINISGWLRLFDHAYAQSQSSQQYQKLTAHVTVHMRKEDTAFYQRIAQEAGHAYTKEGLTALWKQIKAVLPKNRMKQFQARYDIGEQLQQHFAELEAGCLMPDEKAQQQCIDRNNRDLEANLMPHFIELHELPTLVEIEDLCLKQRPHRAAGLDGLPPEVCRHAAVVLAPFLHSVIMKAFLSGVEPFRYKGGLLVPIWKQKGSRQSPDTYRGILLADVFGKILHAWARKRLLPTLVARRAPGQIGGLPSQQTITAVQLLRLHGKIGRACRLSTAAIFVDLRAAFHHMLREFIFTVREPTTQATLQRIFDPNEFDLPQLSQELQEVCAQAPHDIPEALRAFLHDIHKDTWFKLEATSPSSTVTERGTRPGSPMADLGFNLLMSKMMWQIGDKLEGLPAYTQGCQAMGVTIPPLSWVDDLAVPLAVTDPSLLLPAVRDVVAILHETFRSHGMTMNFDGGKSETVIMYRGPGAARYRTELFDTEQQPKLVISTPSHILTMRVVPTYKHLGARFTMDADIALEIQQRASMARQAFEEMKRPLFLNKQIPLKGRLQLYNSLVISRLMYGCPIWADVPSSAAKHMDSLVVTHQRRMAGIGFWSEEHMTDEDFRHHLEVAPFRITWACHRLKYLQHIARHGAPYHKEILLLEFAQKKGWLWEVSIDLQWMASLVDLPFTFDPSNPQWRLLWDELSLCSRWKALVGRAERKHILQERIARDVDHYHDLIVQELTKFGIDVWQGEDAPGYDDPSFACAHCDKSFSTKQALATHAYRKHAIMSAERPYIQSTHCPGCLRDFHTTWRVQQHLKYHPNGCWDRIYNARLPDEPVTIGLPAHLKNVKRLPAVRRLHGPLRPTSVQRQRISLDQRIATLRDEGASEYAWWHPESDMSLVNQATTAFTACLQQWCARDEHDVVSFQDDFFAVILALPVPDLLGGRLFVHWIEHGFYDAWPNDLDPDTILCLEEAYMSMLDDIPAWNMRLRMKRLVQLRTNLPPDEPSFEARPSPRTTRPYSREHKIISRFATMAVRESQRLTWRRFSMPPVRGLAESGPFYIIHLYSGRRRPLDFHEQIEKIIGEFPNLHIRILSIDTAVNECMDVHNPRLWNFLLEIARAGRVLGLVQGPPCETWTSARHHQQVNCNGALLRGPRPLRLADHLWGLEHCTLPELAQLFIGNSLLLKGLLLACVVAINGGVTILEHPAVPFQEEYASIWRLALIKFLLRHPGALFRKTTLEQWRFGASGVKPTTLMFSNTDLVAALDACAVPGLQRPETLLIGKDELGRYKTAAAKEYPPALNLGFAVAMRKVLQSKASANCGGPQDEPLDRN